MEEGNGSLAWRIDQLVSGCLSLQTQIHDRAHVESTTRCLYRRYYQLAPFSRCFRNCSPNGPNFNPSQSQIYKLLVQFFNNLPEVSNPLTSDTFSLFKSKIEQDKLSLMKLVCHVELSTQILKQNVEFNAVFRCLFVDNSNEQSSTVYCHIVTGEEIKKLYETLDPTQIVGNKSTFMENSLEKLKFLDEKRCATFNRLKITKTNCNSEDKCALLFHTTIMVHREVVLIWALSDPVVQISEVNQEPMAEGTIFWMNYFPANGKEPFSVRNAVSPLALARALVQEFNKRIPKRPLCGIHLEYIFQCLLEVTGGASITLKQLLKTNWTPNHSFWVWFYSLMRFLQPKEQNDPFSVPAIWEAGLIAGFVSHENAVNLLNQQSVGTLLLLFSETDFNSFIMVHRISNQVIAYQPWSQKFVEYLKLANCVLPLRGADYLLTPFLTGVRYRNVEFGPFASPVSFPTADQEEGEEKYIRLLQENEDWLDIVREM